jgi:hypothetical protein
MHGRNGHLRQNRFLSIRERQPGHLPRPLPIGRPKGWRNSETMEQDKGTCQ